MTDQDKIDIIFMLGQLRGMIMRFESKLNDFERERLCIIDDRIDKIFYSKTNLDIGEKEKAE